MDSASKLDRQTALKITVIVATYNRSVVLSRTLRTLIAQSESSWQALVIGDACTDDTAEQISALDDERIRFINLPERFGEQAGPNSVGMALADTPYIAFLNHDDYWFPNHLTVAIQSLEQSGSDLYWAMSAHFKNRGAWNNRTLFQYVSPKNRRLEDCYEQAPVYSEPLSAWVARSDAIVKLGPMALASRSSIIPITEYCMRASRLGLTLETSEDITVLKDGMWHQEPMYASPADYGERWVQLIEAGETDEILQEIEHQFWLSEALGLEPGFTDQYAHNFRPPNALIDREIEVNLTEIVQNAHGTEDLMLSKLLVARTGEKIAHQPRLEDMVTFARNSIA